MAGLGFNGNNLNSFNTALSKFGKMSGNLATLEGVITEPRPSGYSTNPMPKKSSVAKSKTPITSKNSNQTPEEKMRVYQQSLLLLEQQEKEKRISENKQKKQTN